MICLDNINVVLSRARWQVTSVIIGRSAEQARLRELVGEVAAGRGRSVLVEGEPGIGKSALIAAGLEGAAGLGCLVLRGAADEYATLAAHWDMTRAEARIRPFGIRLGQRGPRGPHGRQARGWEALTTAELRVVSLVAGGLSNPAIAAELFLSRQTVQTHMSHILAKLGAQSRLQVAREADRHRTDQPALGQKTAS
jgi:DNA-binding CsgD family transcriptional regulator